MITHIVHRAKYLEKKKNHKILFNKKISKGQKS